MAPQETLAAYQRLWEMTERMVVAAKESQWEELVNIEATRRPLLDDLTAADVRFADGGTAAERDRYIRQILDADAMIASLTKDWMAEMQAMLGTVQTQRRLGKAYSVE